ncbi:MAG: T9SS type A sorting domain-containing protein [Flavobacteriales bacterium]
MRHLLFSLALLLGMAATAQPTWRFPICFQNGDGARDTLWMVYDTTATVGDEFYTVDTALGEGRVEMDLHAFNVYTINWHYDSTKTIAWPYTEFPLLDVNVEGINGQPPLTIKWDLSLGEAPFLPPGGPINAGAIYNNYFYYFNNCGGPPCGFFDISLVDSVVIDNSISYDFYFPRFGFSFAIYHLSGAGIAERHYAPELELWPDPARERLFVRMPEPVSTIDIFNAAGAHVRSVPSVRSGEAINIADLLSGTYFLRSITTNHHLYHARFIKTE